MDPALTASQFMEALCLFREARGESMPAKAAMLAVIRNRAADSQCRWPRTTIGVITQPLQFSSFNANDPNSKVWPTPGGNPGAWQAWIECCDVVTIPMTADPTDGATNYEAMPPDKLEEFRKTPNGAWADPAKQTVQIGKTRFYKL